MLFEMDKSKKFLFGKELTLYEKSNVSPTVRKKHGKSRQQQNYDNILEGFSSYHSC